MPPTITPNGTLSYQVAPDANSNATVTVFLVDNGGTANGGQNTSAPAAFVISVTPVTQPPTFTPGPAQSANLDGGAAPVLYTVPNWATNITPGPANQTGETVSFIVTNNNPGLFTSQPSISPTGTLTYATAPVRQGSATVTVTLANNGSTANGGDTTSTPVTFVINVFPVNQAPSFTPGPDETSTVYAGVLTVPNWATNIASGPAGQQGETVSFLVTNDNNALFTVQPSIAPNGTLTYQSSTQAGTANVTVFLQNNGGTANGGHNSSASVTFTITIQPIVVASNSADILWVAQVYRDVLKREIQPYEEAYWTSVFESGGTRLQVAQEILNSDEYHTVYIKNLFQTFLDNPANPTDISNYLTLYHDGWTDEQVKAEIMASAVFSHIWGDTNAGFLNGVYTDVLGFPVDNVGTSFWLPQLDAGVSRYQVALGILEAPGADSDVVGAGYEQLLHRNGSDGLTYWTNILQAGSPDEAVAAGLLASPEYGLNATTTGYNSQPDQNWLNQVYLDTLGRTPSSNEVAAALLQIRQGLRYNTLALGLLNSPEYIGDVASAAAAKILNQPAGSAAPGQDVTDLSQGATIEQVESVMYGTAAFYLQQGGDTDLGFLQALYQDALGRPLDTAGENFYLAQLSAGDTSPNTLADPSSNAVRENVALQVLTSPEAQGDLISAAYLKFLDRPVDSASAGYWASMRAGGLTDQQFYAQLLGSPEYYTKHSS